MCRSIGASARARQRGAVADAEKADARYTVVLLLATAGSISSAIAIYAKPDQTMAAKKRANDLAQIPLDRG